jgi:Mg-chelatase subunit ChlI
MQTAKITIEIVANINDIEAILAKVNNGGVNVVAGTDGAKAEAPSKRTRSKPSKMEDPHHEDQGEEESSVIDMADFKNEPTAGEDEFGDEETEETTGPTYEDAAAQIRKFNAKHGTENTRAVLKTLGFVSMEALRSKGKTSDFTKALLKFKTSAKK